MNPGFALAIALALAFAVTNGLHDASNAIAALVATRGGAAAAGGAARGRLQPARAAAARRRGGGHGRRDRHRRGARRSWSSAPGWPPPWPGTSSPGRAGCPRAPGTRSSAAWSAPALAAGGGERDPLGRPRRVASGRRARDARRARDLAGARGALAGFVAIRACAARCRRGTRRWRGPVRGGSWATSAVLAFGHGSNDAQKSVGVIAAVLVADGRASDLGSPAVGGAWPAPPR